jgi:hypothetical protein
MWHATCTQQNWVNSWLLVVGSQIVNLTLGLSFGHNLCFRCSSGSWKPILDIYVSISFQWYEIFFKPMGFSPCNRSLNIQESFGTQLPTWEFTWECEGSFPHTLLHSRGHENVTPELSFGSHPCNPFALVMSPRLRLWHFVLHIKVIKKPNNITRARSNELKTHHMKLHRTRMLKIE